MIRGGGRRKGNQLVCYERSVNGIVCNGVVVVT